jgi:uncharacterized protein (DUF1697 family)
MKHTYIALLRGINVGGHKIIKMEHLRKSFEDLGYADVTTYVQSGNVVFKAPVKSAEVLAKRIAEMLFRRFGMTVPVIVRTSKEIGRVLGNNPFLHESGVDITKLHVTFLSQTPLKAAVKRLGAIAAGDDRFRCYRQEIYLYCPNGFGGTKLSINTFEKVLSVGATTRNWNTVNKLYEMTLR